MIVTRCQYYSRSFLGFEPICAPTPKTAKASTRGHKLFFYTFYLLKKKNIRSNPHLPVKNLRDTLDFYRDGLGFYEEWIFGDRDGGIRRDDMRLIFGENASFTEAINNEKNRLALMWFMENIDEIFSEFTSSGMQIADPLRTHAYGLREFTFVDINGYYIRVAEGAKESD